MVRLIINYLITCLILLYFTVLSNTTKVALGRKTNSLFFEI